MQGEQPATPTPVVPVPGTIQPAPAGSPSQPAVVTTTVSSPAAPQNPLDQVMWALAMSLLLRYVTNKRWLAFLTPEASGRIKAVSGFLVAASTAAGIHLAVNGSFFSSGGVAFSLTGISFDAFKDIGFQWVSQQAWYDGLVKKVVA